MIQVIYLVWIPHHVDSHTSKIGSLLDVQRFYFTTEFKSRLLLCMLCVWCQRIKRQKSCNIFIWSLSSASCLQLHRVVHVSILLLLFDCQRFPQKQVYFPSSKKKFLQFRHLYKWSMMYNKKVAKFEHLRSCVFHENSIATLPVTL